VHIPDGFIDPATSAGAAVVAAGGLGVSLRRAGDVVADHRAPLAGLVGAFVFAAQMLNFPVAGGTSGHLMGAVLAAVLLGPWLGGIVVAVVLGVQALLFADGGLSALGLNIVNVALIPAWAGYALFRLLRAVLPARPASVVAASAVAGWASVVLAALAFVVEYAIGGNGAASVGTVAAAMVGVHGLIGIGEGVVTALVIATVLAVRPDLVWGARDLAPARAALDGTDALDGRDGPHGPDVGAPLGEGVGA
jgi:cobalt/nickel transport system permease protein